MSTAENQIEILLVEDDVNLGYLLVENLTARKIKVTLAQSGKEGLAAIRRQPYDLCIFDIMLPEVDGFALSKTLTSTYPDTPFLFLTAKNQEQDKLEGFELGADDFITKPFSFKELLYRIQVALRRKHPATAKSKEEVFELGKLRFSPEQRILTIGGQARKLSQREAGLLNMLLFSCGQYITRSEILTRLWGNDDYFTAKSMDVYITRIRKLLKEDPCFELENLYGTGYRIRYTAPTLRNG
jgi:two-component system, OmpR family, response regulator